MIKAYYVHSWKVRQRGILAVWDENDDHRAATGRKRNGNKARRSSFLTASANFSTGIRKVHALSPPSLSLAKTRGSRRSPNLVCFPRPVAEAFTLHTVPTAVYLASRPENLVPTSYSSTGLPRWFSSWLVRHTQRPLKPNLQRTMICHSSLLFLSSLDMSREGTEETSTVTWWYTQEPNQRNTNGTQQPTTTMTETTYFACA
jgi:hypothetical protein